MKRKIMGTLTACCLAFSLSAQSDEPYRNFPIVVSLQFHSLSVPFRNIKSNFSNIGLGVGTEVSLNDSNNWVQQVTFSWYHNKAVGNGLMFYTQATWRPTIGSNVYSELKAGAGYQYSFRPVESFKQVNGDWVSVGRKGKGMLMLPVGISVGSDFYTSTLNLSPFLNYQILLAMGYNKSVPAIPETQVQVGSRMHKK
jgi:hypothetical protein